MRPLTAAVVTLLLFHPSPILAVPSVFHYKQPSHTPTHHAQQRSSWRIISDAIIRKLWGISETHARLDVFAQDVVDRGGPAGKWVARYGEDVVLRFTLNSSEEAAALAEAANTLILDVWEFNSNWVDIRIAKDVVPSLLGLLPSSLQKSHVALMHDLDLAQAIFESYPSPSSTDSYQDHSFSPSLRASSSANNVFFQNYQPLSVIVPWMNLMASMFSTHVRRINVGISYEGRDISGLRVGVHPTNDNHPSGTRKTILITGGSHAREWISTSTVNYLAWTLITSYGKDTTVTKLLEAFDWVFVPTLNPDGYVYSWETDRLWRKNRQPTSLRFCKGVDLDRSYSFQWDGNTTKGNPCSEAYSGEEAFEGVEAKRFADWAKNETESNNVEFITLLDLHSYSQQVLYPYSYTCDESPPTIENLAELALGLTKAIRLSPKGHNYQATRACEGNVVFSRSQGEAGPKKDKTVLPRMETGGGSLLDWFYHELKVHYSFQIKLRDTGSYGFLLPKENIVPTGKEMHDALLYLGRYLLGDVGMTEEGTPEAHLTKQAGLANTNHGSEDETIKALDDEQYLVEDGNLELKRRRRR